MSEIIALNALAERINSEQIQVEQAVRQVVIHAYQCGVLLTEAKQKVSHGQWGQWLKDNCIVGQRMAQNYMRLAANYSPETLPVDSSIREALAVLVEPNTQHVALLESSDKPAWEKENFIEDCRKWPDVFITNTHLMLALKMSPTAIAKLTGKSEEQVLRVANPTLPNRFVKQNLNSFNDLNGLFAQDYDSTSDTWTMIENAEGYIEHYEKAQKHALYSSRELNLMGALYMANQYFPNAVPALEYVINQNQYLLNSIGSCSHLPSPFEPFPVHGAWQVLLFVQTQKINEAMREYDNNHAEEDWPEWNPPPFEANTHIPKALAAMLAADLRYANGVEDTNRLDRSDWSGKPVKESNRAPHFIFEVAINSWMWDYINQF